MNSNGKLGRPRAVAVSLLLSASVILAVLSMLPVVAHAQGTPPRASEPDSLCEAGCEFYEWIDPTWYCSMYDVCEDACATTGLCYTYHDRWYWALCTDLNCNKWFEKQRSRFCGCAEYC